MNLSRARFVLVLICIALAASCSKDADVSTVPQAKVESSLAKGSASERQGLPAKSTRPDPIDTDRYTQEERARKLLERYQCTSEQCDFEFDAASTSQEAAWLLTRGFPGAARGEELERMTLNELELAAGRNDLAAKAVLGRKLIEQGDETAGYTRLFEAATSGSVFADYQLSLATRDTNIYESAAYLRRAYLQGDTKAAGVMYQAFPEFTLAEWMKVDDRAMQLYRSVLVQRSKQGRLPYGPRP